MWFSGIVEICSVGVLTEARFSGRRVYSRFSAIAMSMMAKCYSSAMVLMLERYKRTVGLGGYTWEPKELTVNTSRC